MSGETHLSDQNLLVDYISNRNYKAVKNYIEEKYRETSNIAALESQLKKVLDSKTTNKKSGETLLQFLYNNFKDDANTQDLKDNIELINYLVEKKLIVEPRIKVITTPGRSTYYSRPAGPRHRSPPKYHFPRQYHFITNQITANRPDAGATLIPTFYKHYKSTRHFGVSPCSFKEATDLNSKIPPQSLYSACLLNLIRCLEELQRYQASNPDLPKEKSDLINKIIKAMDDNFENLVSFDEKKLAEAVTNIDPLVRDGNIEILSYRNDPKLARIWHDFIKIVTWLFTAGAYPFFSWLFSSNTDFQNDHTPTFHYLGKENSFASNIANEMSLTLSILAGAKYKCSILKEEEPPVIEEPGSPQPNPVSNTM